MYHVIKAALLVWLSMIQSLFSYSRVSKLFSARAT